MLINVTNFEKKSLSFLYQLSNRIHYQKTCEYCTASFEAMRSDAKYCTDRCRARASQQRQLEKDTLYKQELQHKALQNQIKQTKSELTDFINNKKAFEKKVQNYEKGIAKNKLILSLPQEKKKNIMLDYAFKQKGLEKGSYEYQRAIDIYATISLSKIQNDFRKFNQEMNELIQKQERELEHLKRNYSCPPSPKFKLQMLEQELKELIDSPVDIPILAKPLPVNKSFAERKRKQKRRKNQFNKIDNNTKLSSEGMGGEDIQNMQFDTFTLSGELGRFLGDLDRNKLAFALTGESGSGKSYFSYELARLFLDDGFRVKYYSLEEGIGKLTQEKLSIYDIGNEMTLTGEGGLQDHSRPKVSQNP